MTDVEIVIKGLEHCTYGDGVNCYGCPYRVLCEEGDYLVLRKDALELLKAQQLDIEALKNAYNELAEKGRPVVMCKDCRWYDEKISFCDNCHLPREQTFFCGDGKRRNVGEVK